ncbi:hypothetical protein [Streptosporangium sp. NPDC000396]|uniref:hypothetical protein n=1 Tax=Streptosporangium sp. NPDC000396 TaxID=3366185 RepID=UPI00368086D9
MAFDMFSGLLPISVVLAVILYGATLARNANLADVAVSDGEVLIKPRGVFRFLSFRWSIRIPAESIEWAAVIDVNSTYPPGMRFGATFFPGLTAGTFTDVISANCR